MRFSFLKTKFEEMFGADLRSLAVLRIGTAILILVDLFQRSQDLVAHYTDFGVLPRAAAIDALYSRWMLSLHFANGTWQFQAFLFLIAAVAALALLLGFRTRPATIISWVLLISLDARNVLLAQGADTLLRLVLFWGIFLPWGAIYSVDSALNPSSEKQPERCLTWGTFAYQMQIVFVYWFSVFLKTAPEWRTEGTGVYYTLSIDSLTTPVGQYLLQFPELMKMLTYAVFWFELIGPVLLFFPLFTGAIRTITLLGFLLLHLGFGLCLALGLFPWISSVSLLGFLPSCFWEQVRSFTRTDDRFRIKIYYDEDCGFCSRSVRLIRTFLLLRETQLLPAQGDLSIEKDMEKRHSWVVVNSAGERAFGFRGTLVLMRMSPLLWPVEYLLKWPPIVELGEMAYQFFAGHRKVVCLPEQLRLTKPVPNLELSPFTSAIVAALLLYVFLWNWQGLAFNKEHQVLSERLRAVGYVLRLDQAWNMFAPYPTKQDGWFVVLGQLRYGVAVDVFGNDNGKDVSWEKPVSVLETYKNHHWWRYLRWVWSQPDAAHKVNYARYLCRSWNSNHNGLEKLEELAIFFMLETTLPNYQHFEPQRRLVIRHKCDGS